MIRALRTLDRLYFGERLAGRGSAAFTLWALTTGIMPWGFGCRYLNGEFEDGGAA